MRIDGDRRPWPARWSSTAPTWAWPSTATPTGCWPCGADGTLVNGDELIALFALDLAERGQLAGNTVVVTVMTNLGFRLAMARAGDHREGDPGRGPLRARRPGQGRDSPSAGSSPATSSSGAWPPPGDGLLTGLVLADLVASAPADRWRELLDGLVSRVPQVLVNVPVPNTELLGGAEAVWSAVAEEEARLGDERAGAAAARAAPSPWSG